MPNSTVLCVVSMYVTPPLCIHVPHGVGMYCAHCGCISDKKIRQFGIQGPSMDVPNRALSEKMCVMIELSTNIASASIQMRHMLSSKYNIEMGLPSDHTTHDGVCV